MTSPIIETQYVYLVADRGCGTRLLKKVNIGLLHR